MYTSFFGFRAKPFNNKPELRFHYITPAYAENFNTIRRDIREHQEVLVLTGEAGIGKTLFLQRLVTASQNQDVSFISCPYPALTFSELIDYVCEELGLTIEHMSLPEKIQWLQASLLENLKQGKTIVLVIDDAHNMSDETLGELLSFSSAQKDNCDQFLQIFLIGLSELEEKLNALMPDSGAHKIAHYRLWPLEADEVPKFIAQQLRAAGYQGNTIFTSSAIDRIAEYTKGSLRSLSLLCDASLVIAYLQSSRQVTAEIVDEAAQQHCMTTDNQSQNTQPKKTASQTVQSVTDQDSSADSSQQNRTRQAPGVTATASQPDLTTAKSSGREHSSSTSKSKKGNLRRVLPIAAGLAALALYGVVTAMRILSPENSDIKPLIAYAKAPEQLLASSSSEEPKSPQTIDATPSAPANPEVEALLNTAEKQVDEQKMFSPEGDNAFDTYQQVLQLEPDNEAAQAGLAILKQYSQPPAPENEPERQNKYEEQVKYAKKILREFDEQYAIAKQEKEAYLKDLSNYYIGQAIMANQQKLRYRIETALINNQTAEGLTSLPFIDDEIVSGDSPTRPNPFIDQESTDPRDKIDRLLRKAKRFMEAGKLTGRGDNALNIYRQVIELEAGNLEALAGLTTIMNQTLDEAQQELDSGNLAYAKRNLRQAMSIDQDNAELAKKGGIIAREIERKELAQTKKPVDPDESEPIGLTDPELVNLMLQKASEGNANEVTRLMASGVHPDVRDGYQDTALMLASKNGHIEVVKALLNRGAKIDLTNILGETALIYAARNGYSDVVALLISKHASVSFKTKGEVGGRTALFVAVENGDFATTRLLINNGAMPNMRDDAGRTPLMIAAGLGYEQILKFLLSQDININTQDKDGRTALMLAARNGHIPIIETLLANGAEANTEDIKGKQAIDYATKGGHFEAAELLYRHITTSASNSHHQFADPMQNWKTL